MAGDFSQDVSVERGEPNATTGGESASSRLMQELARTAAAVSASQVSIVQQPPTPTSHSNDHFIQRRQQQHQQQQQQQLGRKRWESASEEQELGEKEAEASPRTQVALLTIRPPSSRFSQFESLSAADPKTPGGTAAWAAGDNIAGCSAGTPPHQAGSGGTVTPHNRKLEADRLIGSAVQMIRTLKRQSWSGNVIVDASQKPRLPMLRSGADGTPVGALGTPIQTAQKIDSYKLLPSAVSSASAAAPGSPYAFASAAAAPPYRAIDPVTMFKAQILSQTRERATSSPSSGTIGGGVTILSSLHHAASSPLLSLSSRAGLTGLAAMSGVEHFNLSSALVPSMTQRSSMPIRRASTSGAVDLDSASGRERPHLMCVQTYLYVAMWGEIRTSHPVRLPASIVVCHMKSCSRHN